jgi:hypothetical protein
MKAALKDLSRNEFSEGVAQNPMIRADRGDTKETGVAL